MNKLPPALFAAITCGTMHPVSAQDGVPDLDYGTMGRAQKLICIVCPPEYRSIAFDAQGRVVIGGDVGQSDQPDDVYAVRFTLEGEVDSSFGENGKAEGIFGVTYDVAMDMDFGPDGSIYLSGHQYWPGGANQDPAAILRWTADGQVDETFGPDGVRLMQMGFHTYAGALLALPDGKVMVGVHHTQVILGDYFTKLVRLTHEGEFDTTFGGGDGIVDYPQFSAYSSGFRELLLQPDGKFLAQINVFEVGDLRELIVRFEADGSLDPTFSDDGILDLAGAGVIFLAADGRITAFLSNIPAGEHSIYRFLPDGSPDLSYGLGGLATIPDSLVNVAGYALMDDGRLLIGRSSVDALGIMCITNEGTIDPDFGEGGYAVPAIFDLQSTTGRIAVGPDQRFATVTSADSDHPLAQNREIAAYMFTADSVWDQLMGVEEAGTKSPVLFPSIYSGGSLWLSAPAYVRSMQWCIVDDQGRRVRDLPLRSWSSAVAVDIGTYTASLPNGVYTVMGADAAGGRTAARFVVLR